MSKKEETSISYFCDACGRRHSYIADEDGEVQRWERDRKLKLIGWAVVLVARDEPWHLCRQCVHNTFGVTYDPNGGYRHEA